MRRPNILFLFPDQLRWDYVGYAGHTPTETMKTWYADATFPAPYKNDRDDPEAVNAVRRNYAAMTTNIDRWIGILKKRRTSWAKRPRSRRASKPRFRLGESQTNGA